MSSALQQQLIDFVYAESRALAECDYSFWLDQFAEDGIYWMPLAPGQIDAALVTSLLYEDKFLLQLRIERLRGERTYSQKPASRCHHLLQRPPVDSMDETNGEFVVSTSFHYVETRRDEQDLYAGWFRHELRIVDEQLKIKCKCVELVNRDAAFGNIQLLM